MESFPSEILEQVIRDECVSARDLLSFSSTCRRFREVGDSNETWMIKFRLSFPTLFRHFPRFKWNKICWKEELRQRLETGQSVRAEVSGMSAKFFSKTELSTSDLHWFDDLLVQFNPDMSFMHLYVTDVLSLILTQDGLVDLTCKHYAEKCITHVKHQTMKPKIMSYLEEGMSYESALIMISQWCQPALDISPITVAKQLDKLAIDTLSHLVEVHPNHPIFSKIRSDQSDSTDVSLTQLPVLHNLTSNLWSPKECHQIMSSVNHVLYTLEEFTGNTRDYYSADNSYINKMMETKQGIPITMCLLYACITVRLGVCCMPVNFPGHFLLKWLEHPEETGEGRQFTFIDAFDGGKQLTGFQAMEMVPHLVVTQEDSFGVAEPLAVAQRMLRNLISIGASRSNSMRDPSYGLLRNSLELMLLINTTDTMLYGFMLSRVYLQLNINHEEVMSMLQEFRDVPGISDQVDYLMNNCQIQMEDRDKEEGEKEPKKRGVAASFPHGQVLFWVGQVCRHKKYHYICLVHGWDPVCTASRSWISQMGVDKLADKEKQPFYNVLVADGSNRYAAQENLEPMQPEPVSHPEVGRYFHTFEPTVGYKPNKELSKLYPDEKQVQWQEEEDDS